jgi:sRNA-binding protein
MSSKFSKTEYQRGLKESAVAIEVLRSLWPNAFPQKGHLVRPLVTGLAGQIAERTGWSRHYTVGVLLGWKLRRAYCDAVLRYDHRFTLDGEEVIEAVVEDAAREQAQKQLAKIMAARRRKAGQRKVEGALQAAEAAEDKTQAAGE